MCQLRIPIRALTAFSELNVIMLREELQQIYIQGYQFNQNYLYKQLYQI